MKIALDPFMHSDLSIRETVYMAAELGYENLEMCSRDEFFPEHLYPRANADTIRELKEALRETGVKLVSLLAAYRWASPNEDERRAAVRNWRRATEICVELGCETVNSTFDRGPSPQSSNYRVGPEMAEECETAFWNSMEELLPVFERESLPLHLEPHPDDFVEDNFTGVNLVRAIGSPYVKYLYCTPHTYHLGDDTAEMIRYAAPVLAQVHVADTFNHKIGWRYVVNPPGTTARVHQHLKIGDGEIDWDLVFKTLSEVGFDGIMTAQVFSYGVDQADECSRSMLEQIRYYVDKYWTTQPVSIES